VFPPTIKSQIRERVGKVCKLVREGEPKTVLTGRENLNRFLRAGKPKQAFSGQETLNRVPLGKENLNKLVRAGGNLENQGFL